MLFTPHFEDSHPLCSVMHIRVGRHDTETKKYNYFQRKDTRTNLVTVKKSFRSEIFYSVFFPPPPNKKLKNLKINFTKFELLTIFRFRDITA